jgi:hypothetical protein
MFVFSLVYLFPEIQQNISKFNIEVAPLFVNPLNSRKNKLGYISNKPVLVHGSAVSIGLNSFTFASQHQRMDTTLIKKKIKFSSYTV